MKKTILLIILICFGCDRSEKNEKSFESIKNESSEDSKEYVESNNEKIALLAVAKDIPYDTLKSILIEYYTALNLIDYFSNKKKTENIKIESGEKLIIKISDKFNLPKRRVASLIYCFHYEMLTQDDIIQIEDDKREEEEYEEQENY